MGIEAVVTLLLGSQVVTTALTLWSNRRKADADAEKSEVDADHARVQTAMTLAENALAQATSLQGRLDRAEEAIRKFQESLYPHQNWDLRAHKAALESDPDFPPPPPFAL